MAKALKPEEKQAMIDMFNSLPADMGNKYEFIAKHFNKATTTCLRVVKNAQAQGSGIQYFDHKAFQF